MSRKQPRIIPWTSIQEWEQVYHNLYSGYWNNDYNTIEKGIKRIKAWKSRGKVPQAIESTATFMEIYVRDCISTNLSYCPNDDLKYFTPISENELRLLYTMTFIRFVNGIIDPLQKGAYAVSISSLAEQLGLPQWFVDLRHEGTHDQLPSLKVLRNGCKQALDWLNNFYWMKQKNFVNDTTLYIRDKLNKYITKKKQCLKENKDKNNNEYMKLIYDVIDGVGESFRTILIPILLEEGMLIPIKKRHRPTYPQLVLEQKQLDLWIPCLDTFSEAWNDFDIELIFTLLGRLDVEEDSETNEEESKDEHFGNDEKIVYTPSYKATAVSWAKYILNKANQDEEFSINDILKICLNKPNKYSRMLLQDIIQNDSEMKKSLAPILQYIDFTILGIDRSIKLDKIQSLNNEEMKEEIQILQKKSSNVKKYNEINNKNTIKNDEEEDVNGYDESETSWIKCNTWSKCPIGSFMGNDTNINLELPMELDDPVFLKKHGIYQIPVMNQTMYIDIQNNEEDKIKYNENEIKYLS
ncbi:Las1-domain-containing protein, partial [Anaeromyces robustus]